MTRRTYLFLFLAGLFIVLVAAAIESAPGYMDAEYYYAGALRIVAGEGSAEPYLWNYLNAPNALPAPAFAYWMPLSSLVAASGLLVAKPLGLWGARLGFLLLAACIPPLTARLAERLTGEPSKAQLAGLFALFPGFYLAYLPTTDAFAIYMVCGGLFFLLAFQGGWRWLDERPDELRLLVLGILAGLLHLARADGLLWLAAVVAIAAWQGIKRGRTGSSRWWYLLRLMLAAAIGYTVMMSPWYARNLQAWGTLMPPGGGRALWITEYEQTMIYPASLLTPEHWLSAGWKSHLDIRAETFNANLQTLLAVQCLIVLLPFILVGFWKLRRRPEVVLGGIVWLIIFGTMTIVFPFAGINGAFFHSGAALQPLFWALAPVGVDIVASAYARWRRLETSLRMQRFLSVLTVLICALLSLGLFVKQMSTWDSSGSIYLAVEKRLVEWGAQPGQAVLVNDPPGYWLNSMGRPAIVVPYGDEQMLLAAAKQYSARYLILSDHDPYQLGDLYRGLKTLPEIRYLGAVGTTRLYEITLP